MPSTATNSQKKTNVSDLSKVLHSALFLSFLKTGDVNELRNTYATDNSLAEKEDDEGRTPLTEAARYCSLDVVKILIEEFGVDVEKTGKQFYAVCERFVKTNCFLAAATGGKDETLLYLHKKYPDLCKQIDEDGDTALTLASQFGSKSTVELLLDQVKLDVNKTGLNGRNCFLAAAEGGKDETTLFLHEKYPELCKQTDDYGKNAFVIA